MAENEAAPDTNAGAAAGQAQQPQVKMNVIGQFIRDLSFENILSQKGASGEVQPDVKIGVNLDAKKRPVDNQYEVAIKLNAESVAKDAPDTKLFIMEIDYVGIFHIENVPDDQLHPFLLIECPRTIFPFLRRIVHDVSRDGGFPPLNLETIDFVSLYRQQLAQIQAQQAQQKPDA